MCGITGVWGSSDSQSVKTMMETLVHRGPDADGLFISANDLGVLGHRRLSIMDPKGGDQPIYGDSRNQAIVGNGEIYNFPQLQPDLAQRYSFTTRSDTEAILRLYEDQGTASVEQLDGMYAFAIADQTRLLVARDPIGIKPLYYAEEDGRFIFASELKAIAQRCDRVQEFPPGTYFDSDSGFSTFYSVPDIPPDQDADPESLIQAVRKTLEMAVKKRLMSDVPVGCFLSGGLDSSLITAIAKQHLDELHTFSIGTEGSRDLKAARLVAEHVGTIHHEYVITPDEVTALLPEILYYLESFDQDLVRSAIPCYFTSRLAAEHVKVILTGEGADELFAGYTYYKSVPDDDTLHRELRRSVMTLHNINLQRVDRMTMAHSIEGRVPFLDLAMIELGQRIPASLKLRGEPIVEKWILRQAFTDLLPEEIVWRTKEQFDEGSGTVDLLGDMLSQVMSESEATEYQQKHRRDRLRSAEECHYHRLLMEAYDRPEPVLANVARWAERPV
ncbi:asparagine synthase B [Romeria aff. gracilis LEGE 07310]|uniref:asparagine synthase (glutamine-hydrolyzing) n=1 Tax=Vasconcelosia minhoensis LEGE 07310 TaxID=915328 RepID=A0A8J7AMY2_9CYAN|nr:asparagine synthase B [Romeria gracilis]MBE9077266.1 asparagine synthase B [Romeria aff. gracilis LEGE 07310]